MNHLLAFFCRCLLFAVFVVTSKLESQTVTLDIMQRVVVSCMQICLLAFVWIVYECCVFIIRSITKSKHYEHVTRDESGLDDLDELITFDNKQGCRVLGLRSWTWQACR